MVWGVLGLLAVAVPKLASSAMDSRCRDTGSGWPSPVVSGVGARHFSVTDHLLPVVVPLVPAVWMAPARTASVPPAAPATDPEEGPAVHPDGCGFAGLLPT